MSTARPKKPNQSKTLRGRPTDPPSTRLSKTLAYLLRHGAEKEGLPIRSDGFLRVSDLLSHPSLSLNGITASSISEIVSADSKTRYTLLNAVAPSSPTAALDPSAEDEGEKESWIRANQGHSLMMQALEEEMTPVRDPTMAGLAVHGTNLSLWPQIYEQGLSRMTRQHIHLALALPSLNSTPKDGKVVSGIRPSATLYIYLDVPLLLSQNVPLYLSANNVLLTPGDPATPGVLSSKYFLKAVDRDGEVVWGRRSIS